MYQTLARLKRNKIELQSEFVFPLSENILGYINEYIRKNT